MKPNSQLKLKSQWIPVTIILVVVAMMTAMVEPAAFARSREEAPKSEEHVADRAVAVALPNRPVIVATMAAPLPQQPQTRTLAAPATGAASAPAKPQSTGKSRKWIFILAAVGAGAAAAAVLARGNEEPAPTITVGSPSVGGPQ